MKTRLLLKNVFILAFFLQISGLFAQTDAADWDLSLNGGIGMSNILVEGASFGLIFEPRVPISANLMAGSKNGISYSTDGIIALETQLYLRWNFLNFPLGSGPSANSINLFIQGGIGFLGALNGPNRDFDVRDSRSSLLFDFTAGVTIPLSSRWSIEPSARAGYPFMFGFAITAGYKFPLASSKTEYIEVIQIPPPSEIIKRVMITQVEYIIFAPDRYRFNEYLDADARSLNELVINHVAQILRDNPNYLVRVEGHANPVSHEPGEIEELAVLSANRANEVARLLMARGVKEEQIVLIFYGGSRIIASDRDHWNMNRRVELIVVEVNTN